MKRLPEHEQVQKALQFIREDDERTLQEQLALCEIPAPSYGERARAEYVEAKFREIGLEDVHIDGAGNVLGSIRGTGNGPTVMLAAHLDTVFPMDTDVKVRKEGSIYRGPGINDDTRAVAELFTIARAMRSAGLRLQGELIFCANVCEEGLGDLRGVKYIFESRKDIDGFVSIDDPETGGIIYKAVGSHRYEVIFTGRGGHSFTDFGLPNPIHAMGRAIQKISDFQVPKIPRTTFNVGVIHGGTSVNTISGSASMLVDLRSESAEELERLSREMKRAVEQAAEEENLRWETDEKACGEDFRRERDEKACGEDFRRERDGKACGEDFRRERDGKACGEDFPRESDGKVCGEDFPRESDGKVRVEIVQRGNRPAGAQKEDCPVVQAAREAAFLLGMEPKLLGACSTDANIPISLGIPALTVGRGGREGGVHTLHEWFEPMESWLGPQRDLLLVLGLGGLEGCVKPVLERRLLC